jgi:hypothetical protein
MSSTRPTDPHPTPHHGSATHLPPSPQEELENLGLVQSEAAAHATRHPDHGLEREAKPTNAGSPTIRRPVA